MPKRSGTGARSPGAMRRALDALAAMRHGKSLTRAARAAHTTASTVKKYSGAALKRGKDGHYAARSDQLVRHIRFLTPEGIVGLPVRGTASASRIGRYWTAVDHFLRTGETNRLAEFRGRAVRVGKAAHAFVTDPRTLQRLAYAGEVSFEDLYAMTA